MDNQEEKRIEELVDKIMREDQLESPSSNFTANLMERLNTEADQKKFVYQPLISKKMWGLLGVILLFSVVYFYNKQIVLDIEWTKQLDFEFFRENNLLQSLVNVVSSNPIFYSVAVLGFFIIIQIPILKRHFEKGLES